MPKRKRKSNKNRDIRKRHTTQRDESYYHKDNNLLGVSNNLITPIKRLDKYRANDYIRDARPNVPRETIRHDLRTYTRNPHLLRRSLRYGHKDQIARVYLLNRTQKGQPYKATPRQGFRDAKRVEVCKRRNARREHLFRIGKAGKGRRIRTKKRLNEYSKVRC